MSKVRFENTVEEVYKYNGDPILERLLQDKIKVCVAKFGLQLILSLFLVHVI